MLYHLYCIILPVRFKVQFSDLNLKNKGLLPFLSPQPATVQVEPTTLSILLIPSNVSTNQSMLILFFDCKIY